MERTGLCGNIIVNPRLSVIGTGECNNIINDPQRWGRARRVDLDVKGVVWYDPRNPHDARDADLKVHAISTGKSLSRAKSMFRNLYGNDSAGYNGAMKHVEVYQSRLDEIEHQRRK